MELYAAALTYAVPAFILLVIIEAIAARIKGLEVMNIMDTVSSLSSGITNTMKSLVGLSLVIISYDFMVEHLAIFEIEASISTYIIAFIGLDFAAYWSHRFNHKVNLFWNRHIIHHSSEEFNLACALRQTIADFVQIYFFLYIPIALIGVPSSVVALVAPIHLFAQFWYHTRLIDRMGFLEHILVTPSHHRVHHAINPEYLDKNLAAIFIIWDKLFGTFQEELKEVPPVYGITRPAATWNPLWINFQHLWLLIQDAWRTKNWTDKFRVWFMPTGWRPKDVEQKYPVYSDKDPYNRPKYMPEHSKALAYWSLLQLFVNTSLLYVMLMQMAKLGFTEIGAYTIFITISIFAYTALMDRSNWAFLAEFIKAAIGFYFLYLDFSWFGLNTNVLVGLNYFVFAYLVLSLVAAFWFTYIDTKGIQTPKATRFA